MDTSLDQKAAREAAFKEVAEWLNGQCVNKGHYPPGFRFINPRLACHRCLTEAVVALEQGHPPGEKPCL